LKANITGQGFRDDGGQLWTPGFLVFVDSPFLNLAGDMAVESVTWTQGRKSGSTAALTLVDPRALGGQGRAGGDDGAGWKTGAGAE
jgi:prophage tail gpP-like protein